MGDPSGRNRTTLTPSPSTIQVSLRRFSKKGRSLEKCLASRTRSCCCEPRWRIMPGTASRSANSPLVQSPKRTKSTRSASALFALSRSEIAIRLDLQGLTCVSSFKAQPPCYENSAKTAVVVPHGPAFLLQPSQLPVLAEPMIPLGFSPHNAHSAPRAPPIPCVRRVYNSGAENGARTGTSGGAPKSREGILSWGHRSRAPKGP